MQTGSFAPVSNRATWTDSYQLTDADDGDLIDLTGIDGITVEIRSASLTATLGSGVTVTGAGTFEWTFTETQMRTLCPGTYKVACVAEDGDESEQIFIFDLPVLDGGVT